MIPHMSERHHHPLFDATVGGMVGGQIAKGAVKELGDRMGLPTKKQLKHTRRGQTIAAATPGQMAFFAWFMVIGAVVLGFGLLALLIF